MSAAVDLLEQAMADDEAHGHLHQDCPFFRHVGEGGNEIEDPGRHCRAEDSKALVKFTPRTPEASTVHQPTVPPGGPGLFGIKGKQLPPYVQHLYKHLVGRYGKQGAYRVAVGVVQKWAKGVHPGGKKRADGKGGHVHADVQAAAAKNVAEWEADKAEAHSDRGGRQVKATAALPCTGALPAAALAVPSFPGQARLPLPPVPHIKTAKAMYTAHRVHDVLAHLAHASERLGEAQRSKALRQHYMIHVSNHLSESLKDAHNLVEALQRNYPAETRELANLNKTLGLAAAVSPEAKAATFAHLLQTVLYHLAHAKRHTEVMKNPDPAKEWEFNCDHAVAHTKGALEHTFKLARHIKDNYPEEARWLAKLGEIEDPGSDYTGLSAAMLPGAQAQYGLWQRPAATVSPGPPLPPSAKIPTPAEVRTLSALVPDGGDLGMARQVRRFIESAAVKLEKDAVLEALAALRSTQAATFAAHKQDQSDAPPGGWTAAVFVPPAAQSSATSAMRLSQEKAMAWRKLDIAVGGLADRIRKNYYHGVYSGPSTPARLSARLK